MEIELYSKLNEPLDAIDRMGGWFASSGFYGCTKAEQGKVLALVCITEQMTPVQVLEKYYVMGDGRLSKKAHGLLATFIKMGGKHTWIKDGSDGKSARLRLEIEGRTTVECEYSMADAEREGLIRKGSVWEKRPRIMMRARCETEGIAMICPEIAVDDCADAEPTATAPLLPPKPVEDPAKAHEVAENIRRKRKDEKPIDAEVVKAEPPPTPEQVAEKFEGKVTVVPPDYVVTIEDGRVSKESVQVFINMCQARGADFEAKVIKWLEAKSYITRGNLFSITPDRLQKIFTDREKWFQVVEAAQ